MVIVLVLEMWAGPQQLTVSMNSHLVTSARIYTYLEEEEAVAVMILMSNLKLSYDKMDAVKETLYQIFPAVQSTVVSVKGED